LTREQAAAALRRGAAIEQMLSTSLSGGSFRWLDARATGEAVTLRLHETVDDGSDGFLDVYAFRSVDEDDDYGAGVIIGEFRSVAAALEGAGEVGAVADQWVNAGVIQDEYCDMRTQH
jgi:hypothetical protein